MAAMQLQERKRKFGDGEPLRNRLTLGDKETTKANKLLEDLFSMVHAKEPAERDELLQRVLHSIAALEQTLDKPVHAVAMNAREKASYQTKQDEVDLRIEASKQEVVSAKSTLDDARAKRRRQEEYDVLAAVALELPSRSESAANIDALQADLLRLQAEAKELDDKFELRKRQFQLLVHTVHDIRHILKEDGELGDVEDEAAPAVVEAPKPKENGQSTDERRPAMYGAVAAPDDAGPAVPDDSAEGKESDAMEVAATSGAGEQAGDAAPSKSEEKVAEIGAEAPTATKSDTDEMDTT